MKTLTEAAMLVAVVAIYLFFAFLVGWVSSTLPWGG